MESDRQVLTATKLNKTYARRPWTTRRDEVPVRALENVSLAVRAGRTLGIVGESGAGKSTLARCLACIERPDTGEICLDHRNLLELRMSEMRFARRQIQLIFQESAASLNPAFSAIEAVSEPATIARMGGKTARQELALAMMEKVGLPRNAANRRCSEFSGGERQRLAIARALSLSPKVLVLDEALSGLDLLIQAQLINLLYDLQSSRSLSYIFISHDLPLVVQVADDLAVMRFGGILENGPADRVSQEPQHPYTQGLFSSAARLRFTSRQG